MKRFHFSKRSHQRANEKGPIASLCWLALATGCSHLTSDIGAPLPSEPRIAVDRSTVGDVLNNAGIPSAVSWTPCGFAFLYEYNRVVENQLGISLDYPVLRWLKLVSARSTLDHEAWLLTFDTNRVLRAWGREGPKKVPFGKGGAAQILVTVQSLVDSSQVRGPSPQHEWGEAWLEPLPTVLNTAQSPDDGRWGLEQTLAPTDVGQHSLEMIQSLPSKQKKKQ